MLKEFFVFYKVELAFKYSKNSSVALAKLLF